MAIYLALKEMWRNRGRFFLISLVIALITTLVLFVAALGEGLGSGNREYLAKLNAELIVYTKNSDLTIATSRMDRSKLAEVKRVDGVKDVGPISFSSVSIVFGDSQKPLNVSLIGVEPGKPGEPTVFAGRELRNRRGREVIIDKKAAALTGYKVGDAFTIKSTQGTQEEFYKLEVVGISDGRQYSLQPSIVVPFLTWDEIKPKPVTDDSKSDLTSNIIAVQLNNPEDIKPMIRRIESQVNEVRVVDRKTAYESTPGYSAQQSTLNTQASFALLIGALVIGGFFQIQTLQKVPQTGMLKAIGTPNLTIAIAAVTQIIAVTVLGVMIGSLTTIALTLSFPPNLPIVLTANAAAVGISSLLMLGPVGGLVSIRYALRVEPLKALGLS